MADAVPGAMVEGSMAVRGGGLILDCRFGVSIGNVTESPLSGDGWCGRLLESFFMISRERCFCD